MPLAKFEPLQQGIEECWIDLLKVSSIWPLLGVPDGTHLARVDLGEARVIGCRACVEGKIFDLVIQPDDLANQVSAAKRSMAAVVDQALRLH